jgi:hypothetical protein
MEHLSSTVYLACAQVLGGEGRNGGEHGRGYEEEKADDFLYNTYGGSIVQTTLVGYDGDEHEAYLYETVLQSHGKTYAQERFHGAAMRMKVVAREAYVGSAQGDVEYGKEYAGSLCQDGGEGGTGGCIAGNEKVVGCYVDDAGYGHEVHGGATVSESAEDAGHDVVGYDGGYAKEADAKVVGGLRDALEGGGNERYNTIDAEVESCGKKDGQAQKEGDGVAYDVGGLTDIAGAYGLGNADGGAHGETYNNDGNEVHDLTAQRDGGDGGDVMLVILADDEEVGQSVEELEEVCEEVGDGEAYYGFRNVSFRMVRSNLLHCCFRAMDLCYMFMWEL